MPGTGRALHGVILGGDGRGRSQQREEGEKHPHVLVSGRVAAQLDQPEPGQRVICDMQGAGRLRRGSDEAVDQEAHPGSSSRQSVLQLRNQVNDWNRVQAGHGCGADVMHCEAGWAEGASHPGHVAFRPRRPAFVRRNQLQGGQHPPGLAVKAARKQCPGGDREIIAAQPSVAQAGIGGPSLLAQHPGGTG